MPWKTFRIHGKRSKYQTSQEFGGSWCNPHEWLQVQGFSGGSHCRYSGNRKRTRNGIWRCDWLRQSHDKGKPAHLYVQVEFQSYTMASLVAQTVENLSATRETRVQSLGWEDPLEKGMAAHSNILTWRIPWTEEPGGLQSMASQSDMTVWLTHDKTNRWGVASMDEQKMWFLDLNIRVKMLWRWLKWQQTI